MNDQNVNEKEEKKRKRNYALIIALLLVVGISIGYAILSVTLNIAGGVSVPKTSWDVHFENLTVAPGSAEAITPAAIHENKLDINYEVKLNEPRDYYEFEVDVVNAGTIPAKLSATPQLLGLTDDQKKYTVYTVTYVDSGEPAKVKDSWAAGTSKRIKVRVLFSDDVDPADLPSSDQAMRLTYAMNFIQG